MFDKEKVLTPFTAHKAEVGSYGHFGDTARGLESDVEEDDPRRLKEVREGTSYPFGNESGFFYEYFLPASYDFMQKKWVEEVGLKVGDSVKLTRGWCKGEAGYEYFYTIHHEKGKVYTVTEIKPKHIKVAGEGYIALPYFSLEKVTETHRPFANAEEFKPYREGWWQFRTSGVVFKVDTYQEDGVYVPGEEKRVPFDVFLDKYTNADTGEPAGVKL